MVTIWSPGAKRSLKKAFEFIKQDSPQNADKFLAELLSTADQIAEHPEMFLPDKYKVENDGSWRVFEKYHYRISYRILKTEIRIIRVRHTSRSPKQY